MKVSVNLELTRDVLENIFVTALEGGSNYWYLIEEEAIKFGRSSYIRAACVYGGAPKSNQIRKIQGGVEILIATPGRLNDLLEMRVVDLSQVLFLVLDEADRM